MLRLLVPLESKHCPAGSCVQGLVKQLQVDDLGVEVEGLSLGVVLGFMGFQVGARNDPNAT